MTAAARLLSRIGGGRAVLGAEILSSGPRGELLGAVGEVAAAGARILFFPDAPGGVPLVDSLVAARAAMDASGLPAIPHLNCRDRNLLALRAARRTLDFLDIPGVKAVTGDPIPAGQGQGVYDLRSPGLLDELRSGDPEERLALFAGHSFDHPDPEQALVRLKEKVENGAGAIITTPTLDGSQILRGLERWSGIPVPVMATLTYAPSVPMLDFLVDEVPCFRAPEGLRQRLLSAPSPEDATQAALDAALDVARAVRNRVAGFIVAPPFGRWQGAIPLLKALAGLVDE